MVNYLEIAQENNLTLIEVSILVRLNQRYPHAVSMDELSEDEGNHSLIKQNINKLVSKNLAVPRFQKYLIRKDHG
ncbi:hypothetical protein [Oceanobacillus sp. CF4.6]|uniref:hypothetical protein n=1 Tax=Oceanobacillus sp. CF4.6 TaxID=3373080 RepID=UPI003EE42CB7